MLDAVAEASQPAPKVAGTGLFQAETSHAPVAESLLRSISAMRCSVISWAAAISVSSWALFRRSSTSSPL